MTESQIQTKEELRDIILEIIKENNGITFSALLDKVNERVGEGEKIPFQKVATKLKALEKEGLIEIRDEKEGKKYYIAGTAPPEKPEPEDELPRVPTLSETLDEILETYGITGKLKERIKKIVEINPYIKTNYEAFFNLLISNRIEPNYARLITDTVFARIQYEQKIFETPRYGSTYFIEPPQPNPPRFYPPSYDYPRASYFRYAPIIEPETGRTKYVLVPAEEPRPPQPQTTPPPQPQQPSQPIVIKTGEVRKIRRPVRDKDGNIMKDENGNIIYEEVEEPITLVAGGLGTETLLTTLIQKFTSSGKEDEKLMEEREKRYKAELEALESKLNAKIELTTKDINQQVQKISESVSAIPSVIKDLFKDHIEDENKKFMQLQHQKELEEMKKQIDETKREAEARAGEPAIVSMARELRKGLESIAGRLQPMWPMTPGQQPQPLSQQEAIQQIAKMREQLRRQQPQQPQSNAQLG